MVVSLTPVKDFEYVLREDGRRGKEESVLDKDAEAISAPKTAKALYYAENESGGGVVWRPKLKEADEQAILSSEPGKEKRVGRGYRFAHDLQTGEKVTTKEARKLAQGFDPSTGEELMPAACEYHRKKMKDPKSVADVKNPPTAGNDLTFNPDKGYSALWAGALIEGRFDLAREIQNAFQEAVKDTLQDAFDRNFFQSRLVKGSGKDRVEWREPVKDVILLTFEHQTARPTGDGKSRGDPLIHNHCLALNMGICHDGVVRALDTDALYYNRPVMDAVMKANLYKRLQQIEELKDLDIIRGDRDVKINGIPQALIDALSSRRKEIETYLEEIGMSTADRRAAAIAARKTRGDKDTQPPLEELLKDWDAIIRAHTNGKSLFDLLVKKEIVLETREEKMERVAQEAIARLGDKQTVVSDRDVIAETIRSCAGEFDKEEYNEVVNYVKTKHLVLFDIDEENRLQFAVRHLAEKEVSFMNLIMNMPTVEPLSTKADIERILTKYGSLNDEQAMGINYLLSSTSPILNFEGSAGTGKTFTMKVFREAVEGVYRELGYEVHGISPSWKAAGGLRDELELRDEVSKALAKWIADHKAGKFAVTEKTIVIIDEAGMAGMAEMEYITRVVSEAGGRIVMLGDVQQLSPVAAGSPMALSLRVNGGHRLNVIMRQKDDTNEETKRLTALYREASAEFVLAGRKGLGKNEEGSRKDADAPGKKKKYKINPHIEKALRIYYDEGRMIFKESALDTYHASADQYVKALELENGNMREVLMITNRNSDLHKINAETRMVLIKKGVLGSKGTKVKVYTRDNRDDEVGVTTDFRDNDRIIFGGKQIVLDDGFIINNSDMATIQKIVEHGKDKEPEFHLVFDKDPSRVVVVTPSQLSVVDPFNKREPRPVMQHAYCVTVHASQGVTVNRCILSNPNGVGYSLAYVGMTRHRKDAWMVVNTERIELNKLAKQGIIMREEDGRIVIPHEDGERFLDPEDFKLTEEHCFKTVAYEASIWEPNSNVSDHRFLQGKKALADFMADENRFLSHSERLIHECKDQLDNLERTVIDNKARLDGKVGKSKGFMVDPIQPKPENILKGENNPFEHVKPIEQPSMEALKTQKENIMARNYESKLISDAEKAKFYDTNPLDILRRYGVQDVPGAKNDGKTDYFNLCMDVVNGQPKGKMYLAKGVHGWVITEWKSRESVRIDTWLYQNGHAPSKPHAWHLLRDLMSTENLKDSNFKAEPRKVEPPKPLDVRLKEELAMQTEKSKFPAFPETPAAKDKLNRVLAQEGPNTIKGKQATQLLAVIQKGEAPNAKPAEKELATKIIQNVEAGKGFFASKLDMTKPLQAKDVNYMISRGIHPAVLVYVNRQMPLRSAPIKCQKTGEYVGGIAAYHMGPEGPIGHDTKRAPAYKQEGDGFKPFDSGMYSPGGGRSFATVGYDLNKGDAKTIIAVEGTPDLCVAVQMIAGQDLPNPKIKTTPERLEQLADQIEARMNELKTTVGSTAGRPSSTALVCIEDYATRNKGALWPNGSNHDPAGREFRKAITESILAGDPSARFSEMTKPYYNDLNDMHLNKPLAPEAVMKTVNSNRTLPENKRFNQSRDANEIYSEANVRKHMEAYNRDHPNSKVNLDDYKGVGFTEAEIKQFRATIAELKVEQTKVEIQKPIEVAKPAQAFSRPDGFQRPQVDVQKPAEIRLPSEPKPIQPKKQEQAEKPSQVAKPNAQPSMRNGFTRPAVTMRQADEASRARQQKEAAEARAREAAARKALEEERNKGFRM